VAFIGLLILIFHKNQARWSYYFSLHAAGIVLLYFFYRASAGTRREGIRFLRDILMPILLIFYYEETESLNHMVTGEFLDPFFAGIEEAIFGCQPAFEFVKVMPQAWLANTCISPISVITCLFPGWRFRSGLSAGGGSMTS